MAIPASELVRVQPRVLAGTGQDLAFNGLFLTENALAPVGTLLTFRDAASVSGYFGSVSNEAKVASLRGYNNEAVLVFPQKTPALRSGFQLPRKCP